MSHKSPLEVFPRSRGESPKERESYRTWGTTGDAKRERAKRVRKGPIRRKKLTVSIRGQLQAAPEGGIRDFNFSAKNPDVESLRAKKSTWG